MFEEEQGGQGGWKRVMARLTGYEVRKGMGTTLCGLLGHGEGFDFSSEGAGSHGRILSRGET